MKSLLASAALVAAFPFQAHADEAQMREHVAWIADHSDLEYHGEPLPLVLPETQRGLQMMFYGADMVVRADMDDSTALGELEAIYDHNNDVIFVRSDLPDERRAVTLFHELVHYMQDINGVMASAECPAATERQAYGLQAEWQDATDDPTDRPDPFTVLMLSMCPRDFY